MLIRDVYLLVTVKGTSATLVKKEDVQPRGILFNMQIRTVIQTTHSAEGVKGRPPSGMCRGSKSETTYQVSTVLWNSRKLVDEQQK